MSEGARLMDALISVRQCTDRPGFDDSEPQNQPARHHTRYLPAALPDCAHQFASGVVGVEALRERP